MEKSNAHDIQFKFSHHARVRQEQRNITDNSVNAVLNTGEQTDCKNSMIYTNQNVKVVFSKDSRTVITVNENTRNTRFQLSERTKQKEQSLLYKANVQNDDHAMCKLAELYLTGELGTKDYKKAYSLFERAAQMGNSHAMCRISVLYEDCDFGVPNQELADKWLKKAADKNNVYALGVMGQKLLAKYLKNYPIKSNIFRPSAPKKEILYYLSTAADKGSTRATWQLGNIYEEGWLDEQDLSKAIELYVKAAKTGSPSSLDSLYQMCLKGNFNAIELEEILENLSLTLPTTSIDMAFQIGGNQLIGDLGYNPIRGLKMIEQVAFKEHEEAIQTLLQCYCNGVVCNVDLTLAQYWAMKLYELYEVSAKNGNVFSLWNLGTLHLNGSVGNIDLIKAESCFKEAIEKFSSPNPDQIYQLGKLYWEGRLGDKPINIGVELITQAINIWKLKEAQGDTTVYYKLGVAYRFINDFKNCVHWLSKSSNDINAKLLLVKIYLDDSSPEKNIPLGLKIFESVVLEYNVAAQSAFRIVNFPINDQTICWLHSIADNIKQPKFEKNSNQYKFQQFVTTTLAEIYEKGKVGEIDYKLASKYYHQLLINFESIAAGNKLIILYNNHHLHEEYYDTAKEWACKIPKLLENDEIDQINYIVSVILLGKTYQKCNLLSYDVQEATKWLYYALYLNANKDRTLEIEHDLASLPQLDCNQKEQIVYALSQMASNFKIISSIRYKVICRILGDIFYDDKIINQNIDKAIYWYTESANKNNSRASLALARIYQYDKQDIDASVKWYMTSIQQGNEDALKTLASLVEELNLDGLSTFLNRYKHKSQVEEFELINVKPFWNLQSYPKTTQEMYELGKYYLTLENDRDINILNAAFWFRKAMSRGNIDAKIELYSMYKSSMLGINLIPFADNLYTDILRTCYHKLKDVLIEGTILEKQSTSLISSLLNNISSILKRGGSSNTLNTRIEELINKTRNNIDTKILKDLLSDLALLVKVEYTSNKTECTISNTLDKISLFGEETPTTS